MKKIKGEKKRQYKKTGILLFLLLIFAVMSAGFFNGQKPEQAKPLGKEDAKNPSRVFVIGKGSPLNYERQQEIKKEQEKIEKEKSEKVKEEAGQSSVKTAPNGTDGEKGTDSEGDNTGAEPENPNPGVDSSKLPRIHSSLRDGEVWPGPLMGFGVSAQDYQGRLIPRATFVVYANGQRIYSAGDMYNANYYMKVLAGTNKVVISVTDSFGVTGTREYTFTGDPSAPPKKEGTLLFTLEVRTLGGGYIFKEYPVTIYKGENLAYVVKRALESKGFTVEYTGELAHGFYVTKIEGPGILQIKNNCVIPEPILAKLKEVNASEMKFDQDNKLGQFDFYGGSGWIFMYLHKYITGHGLSDKEAKDGDELTMAFTLHYGYEYSKSPKNPDGWFNGNW